MYNPKKPCGSVIMLIFWILFFWPIAIIYACSRHWGHNHPPYYCEFNNNYYPPFKTQEEKLKEAFTSHIISAEEYEKKFKELKKN
jgi:uncharacterized membrane protein